uniref:HYDIN axonemal central pair apparatus protein n=1 Tax=Coturnix japonica TaxID=93934 RepID=A0A8C2T888_COTJA
MATNNLHQSVGSSKNSDGFQNEVVAPYNSKLVSEMEEPVTLTPSAFLKEMSLTTEQRLATIHSTRRPHVVQLLDISDTSHQKFSSVDLDQPLFQPFPPEVVFQSYVPCEVYEVPLVLRNNDRVPRLVKVVLESSPYFKLISPGDVSRKVAPGMLSTFRILFTPEENKDYFHQLTCITEREKFVVPIRAIGARAILDFPDQINFSVCPVKHSTQRTLLVCNVGNREARYSISTHSPFSVDPSVGTLSIGDTVQVTVEFYPLKTGDHCGSLVVHYDTGEYVLTSLYGAAVDVNIRLDRNSLMIAKTYLTLANQRSVVIHNRSNIIAHFQWKAFVNQEEEDQQKLRLCHRLRRQEEDEMDRFIDECMLDPSLQEHLTVLCRVFQNNRAKVQGDSMLFSDDIFTIEPVEGDVWPNSSAEINVMFKPREARLYQLTVYCDISGRETRLPLRIKGEGEGPRLRFSFDQLDIGKVFVGSAHNYEVILFNKGPIDALFHMVPSSTALGSCFAFVPREGLVPPGGLQHIRISFCSTILGQFTEQLGVNVHGCPQPVTLTVRGCVIGPTFHFDVPSLHFGDVSFGFPHTLSCRLSNTSLVPMTFSLRIPGDGSGPPSVSSSTQVLDNTLLSWKMGLPAHPKPTEFTVMPSRGTIRAQGTQDVQVTLCSNTVKQYEMALVVDVDGVGTEVLALLLTARCVVPHLRLLRSVLPFGFCFLQHPYQRPLTLVNDSDVPGCYGLLPQVCFCSFSSQTLLRVLQSPLSPCGIIQPHSSVEVPVTLRAQVTGKQLTAALVAVFGREEFPLVKNTGEGPVVYAQPSKLNFGRIPVLQDASQTLHLSNQAFIPASFWTEMVNSCWRVEPKQGIIPPESEVSLAVIANLDDTQKFQDNLNIFIENSSSYVIPVQAVGIGTTIVTDKPFAPELDLGPHFSMSSCSYHFKITNKGRRTHQLYWTTEGFAPFRQHDRLPSVGGTKDSSPKGPVFRLWPLRMELIPGRTMEMILEGFSSTPRVVTERLLCHAIIGSKIVKTQIMQVDVTCEFIAPVLQLSSREITFRVEKVSVWVVSSCSPLKLNTGEEHHLTIRFNPDYEEGLNIRVAERTLNIRFLEHPLEEHVAIRGEVYFPNLHMETMTVDFGCILNDTEDVRYVEVTNCSPLLVRYRWSFLAGSHVSQMRYVPCPFLLPRHILHHNCCSYGRSSLLSWEFLLKVSSTGQKGDGLPRNTSLGHPAPTSRDPRRYLQATPDTCSYKTQCPSSVPPQLFNEFAEAELTLQNSGKVGFQYRVLSPSDSSLPSVLLVLPSTGYVGPGQEQVMKVSYLPGVPGAFCRTFQIQVGHLEPETITLKGEGSFPRICMDLPRNIRGELCLSVPRKVPWFSPVLYTHRAAVTPKHPLDIRLQMQMEEMLVEERALEQQKLLVSCPPEDYYFDKQARQRVQLPEYILNFGHVILGNIHTHIVKITNTGQLPVSFCAVGRVLRDTGFTVELDRVTDLPYCETQTFEVRFDPQSANVPLGEADVLLPIKVTGGPTFHLRLHACVTMPSLCISRDSLEFSTVQCGQCQEETIQLYNRFQVPCKWFVTLKEPVDKYLPANVRRKLLQELKAKPCAFEVLPLAGDIAPGQRCNMRVRFTPTEERSYRCELKINICQSSQPLQLQVTGHGLEPQLEFDPPVLELAPVLPYSDGSAGTVVVKNPCEFPIEFYSLEFDQQYLAEEQILQMLKDYDCRNTLLLPPRAPGENLPPEVLEYYQDHQKRLQDEQTKSRTGDPEGQDNVIPLSTSDESQSNKLDAKSEKGEEEQNLGKRHGAGQNAMIIASSLSTVQSTSGSKEAAGELDDSPVFRAIARHLGIDISPEGRAAQNRRGIAIIIHGAPLTGKTSAAVTLSRHYGAACLSIDSLVMEAISDRSSSAGIHARELCLRAAIEQSQKEAEDAGMSRLMARAIPSTHVYFISPCVPSAMDGALGSLMKSDNHAPHSQKQHHTDPTGSQVSTDCTGDSCDLSSVFVLPQTLSPSTWSSGETGLLSCVLPDDVLGAILSERLQLSDCYKGVVFDGLETLFARSMASALLCLLKAVNNRPYIYFVNLFQDYASWRAKEMAAKEKEEREQEEAARRERAHLLEMDEEEYDALTEEQRAQFDDKILQIQRERRRSVSFAWAALQYDVPEGFPCSHLTQDTSDGVDRKGSTKEHSDSAVGDKDERKSSKVHPTNASPAVSEHPISTEQEEDTEQTLSESEKMMAMRFKIYEASQKDITYILSYWDRVQGALASSLGLEDVWQKAEEQSAHVSSRKSKRDREKERLEKERQERERQEKLKALEEAQAQAGEGAEGPPFGVPCLDIQVLDAEDAIGKILESGKLPPAEQILDSLGLGPSGPPIPPTAFYSVIHYPEKRVAPTGEALKHFVFIIPQPHLWPDSAERKTLFGGRMEDLVQSDKRFHGQNKAQQRRVSEEQLTPTKGKARKEKTEGNKEVKKEKRSSARSKKSHGTGTGTSVRPADVEQSSVDLATSPGKAIRLSSYRWIVPACGQVELKVHFTSSVLGQFDQTMNFEVLGTKRLYQLHCRGICVYPTISQDPRVVFPHRRKSKADDDIIFKQYVMSTGVFHFGPLLCGKSRDWYKALPYPSNYEKITILNITPLEVEVHFFFEHDLKADTFISDPPSMTLKPNEKQELSIWAYPTSAGLVEDKLVCCIKDNPEPVVFQLCCQGVRVELGVSTKQVQFGKLLLHRRESKQLVLRNPTLLPVAWRFSGLENLGEDFSVSQSEGTVEPRAELEVYLYFKATKVLSIKKTVRLEISDAENILGIAQTENIQIQAEAYDVALSISISKGMDGNVDFGVLKVQDDAKQVLTLKNKGKYEIAYSFTVENADTNIPDLESHFAIQPQSGLLPASERPVHVHLTFHPTAEIDIQEKPILKCQVIEPSICEGGEAIAIIPVNVSAKALFSKYSITPASLIDFGTVVNGTKKTCNLILENKGSLDFKYVICKAEQEAFGPRRKRWVKLCSACPSHESVAGDPRGPKNTSQPQQKDPSMQARFTLGMFTVYPGFGSIHPGEQQTITVDCQAEPEGTCEEHLSIDISDRDPEDNPCGIPYTLLAESCLPAFVVDDVGSIFEEHRICSNANLCQILQTVQDKGVFITDENKFIFTNVLVGHRATARFKIRNVGKVPCDVILSIKPISAKVRKGRISDIFEVDPTQMCVPSHSHAFATVTFTPQTMQSYQCTFEAYGRGILTFDISGEGNLPRVTVLRPVLCNKKGNPLLLFKKLLLGDSEKLPLVLQNGGIIPVQVLIDLLDEAGAFFLKARPTTHCIYQTADTKENSTGEGRKPHTASLVLHHGESAEFDVLFKPKLPQRAEGQIHLSVVDNPYEETYVQLVGEGYEDDFTLDNIHGLLAESFEENTEGNLEEDVIEGKRIQVEFSGRATGGLSALDHIQFGDCHIGKPYQVTFTVTNRSQAEAMRFEWLADTPFHFSPQVGHLHAGCAKDITVTLKSDVAFACQAQPVKCKVARISFQLPAEQVTDWDDRLHTVKWVDTTMGETATWPVIETDPEPAHTVLEKSSREVELHLSAVVDYADFKLEVDTIQFKETLLFQTRTFPFRLSNTGNVALEYTWMADVDERALPLGWMGHALEHTSSSLSSPRSPGHATSVFSVEPTSGTIPAGQEQLFQMKFSPVRMGNFKNRMVCSIPNLKPDQKAPVVAVKGKSQRPRCHFELEDSDYITANRRKPELPEPRGAVLDQNTRVIEFTVAGVGGRNSRTFKVMNPTSSTYSFEWTCQDPEAPPGQKAFFCLTERGQIQPGKKAEMKFEFIPRHLDVTESFWVFTIPEKRISVLFLLVGHSAEPLVTLDRSYLNLQLQLVGEHMTIYMINSEKEAFTFAFRESSLFPEGYSTSVKVEPMKGSIAPLSRFPITVAFTPTLEGEVVFNLKCDVKRKTEPLSLNIKATSYTMSVSVRCEDSDGGVTELSAQEVNIIDFKEVQLNESTQRTFSIHNNGKFSFAFSWELSGPISRVQLLSLSPMTGSVQAEGKVDIQLVFHPRKMCSLKNVELTLKISKGPMFICAFLATVVVPTVYFSTTRLNFGACFIYHAGMPPAQQTFTITNKADRDVSLNCLFINTVHLEVDFPGYILCPGATVEVPITFYPREVTSYHELITFDINGLCQRTVEVLGKGAEMKVDVVEPPGKVVKLGALSVGQTVKKVVTIANNSVAPLTFNLCFMPTTPELQEDGVRPPPFLYLKPKGDTIKVKVIFSPKQRIQPFTEEVMLESSGLLRSLFMVQGSCQGICVSLDQEHLSFGAVMQQSCASQRIIMQNTGDVGVKFQWDIKSFKPDFSISPTKGYISPGMDVPFMVRFHPSKMSLAIRYEGLQCFIQGSEPLCLTLTGCCMDTPIVKETLIFSCNVREMDSQTILLSNPSNEPWTVKPVIEGDHWKGPECIHLEGNQQEKPYTITYEPLTMSSEERKHQGSIFFPLPDGTGLYYLLHGTAEDPDCSGTIVREVPCRTPYTVILPVSNWLNKPQRFLVVIDILKPEDVESSSVLHGLDFIDVPGSGKKDYKLTFLSYKEEVFSAMVTFINEVTEEYLFYTVTFKAIASGPIGTVEVSAAVRQSVSSSIKVDNPLDDPVVFDIDCKVPEITVPPHFTVPAQSEADLVFEYQPLKVGESTERLMLHSTDLGSCYYELILKATTSKPEKPLYFCTTLGSNQTITTKIMNYNRQKTEYILQTDCADFQTEKTITMPPASLGGSEVSVEVTYEPCQLGESRATLQLLGPPGGDYSIPLFGLALAPKPQGPFLIKAGGSTNIPFKNIFPQPTTFRYSVENPAFSVRATETLRPKKNIFMAVSFEGNPDGTKTPISSRLVVSCARADGLGAGISWVFYLRGLPLEK